MLPVIEGGLGGKGEGKGFIVGILLSRRRDLHPENAGDAGLGQSDAGPDDRRSKPRSAKRALSPPPPCTAASRSRSCCRLSV